MYTSAKATLTCGETCRCWLCLQALSSGVVVGSVAACRCLSRLSSLSHWLRSSGPDLDSRCPRRLMGVLPRFRTVRFCAGASCLRRTTLPWISQMASRRMSSIPPQTPYEAWRWTGLPWPEGLPLQSSHRQVCALGSSMDSPGTTTREIQLAHRTTRTLRA